MSDRHVVFEFRVHVYLPDSAGLNELSDAVQTVQSGINLIGPKISGEYRGWDLIDNDTGQPVHAQLPDAELQRRVAKAYGMLDEVKRTLESRER